MKNRIIIYLIRKKLKLNKNQLFKFKNQKDTGKYYFSEDALIKICGNENTKMAHVGLNYLISDECKVLKLNKYVL